jgi:RNA polymerase sigma factor (sigma-70 family)
LPWLYGVATNVLRNQRRSQRRYDAALARLPRPLEEPDFADSLTDRLDDEQRMRLILSRLRTLSRLEQEVLSLCVWEGLTPQAAAIALAIPEATVRTRLHRAREHLRTLGEGDADGISTRQLDVTQGDLP